MKTIRNSIIINIILMIILSIAIVIGIYFALSYYTKHSETIIVPQIKGDRVDIASKKLNDVGLSFEVIDSVYTDKVPLGGVFETLPREGSSVKSGRVIYITINAISPMKVAIPDIENNSVRQAMARLNALKINNITIKEVSGDFDDLCLRIETLSGNEIRPNTKIDIDMPIILVVSKKAVQDSTLVTPSVSIDDDWLS